MPDDSSKVARALDGVIFDMDGVLSDSEMLVRAAAIEMFRVVYGLEVQSSDFEPFVGSGEDRYLRGVAERHDVVIDATAAKATTYEIYYRLIPGHLKPVEGAVRFLRSCQAAGLKISVATGADRDRAEATLQELALAGRDFTAVVTGSEVSAKKPAPDIFLAAATAMNLVPERCLVVEDALLGVQAAKSAGSRCLGLTTSFGSDALRQAGADWTARSFLHVPEPVLAAIGVVE